jgi:excinuclease ABC subunit C
MTFQELKEKALNLPMKPGVYIMMDKSGEVIYVGKAKLLKNRVISYFRENGHDAKTMVMVSKIDNFDIIVAETEFDALVTENSLIKNHKPKYNIRLKDDKGYPYVRVDMNEEYPRFSVASKPLDDGAKYLGPYNSRTILGEALSAITKAFKLPTCSRKFPADINRERPCLNYHMGICSGYCRGRPDAGEYRKIIGEAIMVLEGRSKELCIQLQLSMEQAAEKLQFETAAEIRDRLKALSVLETKQLAVSASSIDTDVIGYYQGTAKSCFVVLHYIGGKLLGKDFEIFETPVEDSAEAVSALLRQYYLQRGACPKNILLPVDIPDIEPLSRLLSEAFSRKVSFMVPQKGEKHKLVSLANMNAMDETERATGREERISKTLELLQKALDLPNLPKRIEAFDISNTGDSDIVGSMTVFENARALKRDYRRFKIKSRESQDDYHSMQEVLSRRFTHFLEGDEKFGVLPDLLLVAGGATHASMAENVICSMGLHVPVFGMVKDDRHKTRALISPEGNEIGITSNPAVFSLIGRIQEETHRFAIEYHRKLRSKKIRGSALDSIKGVGESRRSALLKTFKSIKAIENASFEELKEVVPKNTAEAVFKHFHPKSASDN